MPKTQRRYYFANTIAAVIVQLRVPEQVKPNKDAVLLTAPHIAWMAIKVARMDVHDPSLAQEASRWVRRIMQAMEAAGYWSRHEATRLHNLDKEQHFHQPVEL